MSSSGSAKSNFAAKTLLRFLVTFTDDLTGELADPTDIKLAIQFGGYTPTVFTYLNGQVVRESTGTYHYDYDPPQPGDYLYAWQGTGFVEAATENQPFTIDANLFS